MKIWKLLLISAMVMILMALLGCGKAEDKPAQKTQEETTAVQAGVTDHTPTADEIGKEFVCGVCGMTMTIAAETPGVNYDGKTYYFCTADEKKSFAADPKAYLTPSEQTE